MSSPDAFSPERGPGPDPAAAPGAPAGPAGPVSVPAAMALGQLATFAVLALLARARGPAELGRYVQAYAVFAVLSVLLVAGLRPGIARAVADARRRGNPARLRALVVLALAVPTGGAVLVGLLLLATAPALVSATSLDPALVPALRLAGLALVGQACTDAAVAAMHGLGLPRYATGLGMVLEPAVRVVATGAAVALGSGADGAMAALVVSNAVAAVAAVGALHRLRLLGLPGPAASWPAEVGGFSTLSWTAAAAASGLVWADTLLLGALRSSADVGRYALATRLVALAALALPLLTAGTGGTLLARAAARDAAGLARGYQELAGRIARLALPGLVLLLVLPRDVLTLFGPGMAGAAAAMVVLGGGKVADLAAGPNGLMLSVLGRAKLAALDGLGVLLVNVGLNLALIPRYGIVGAAWAWTASAWLVNAVRAGQVWLVARIHPVTLDLVKALAAADVMLGVLLVVALVFSAPWRLPLGVLLGVEAYLGATLAFGLPARDRQALAAAKDRGRRLLGGLDRSAGRHRKGTAAGPPPPVGSSPTEAEPMAQRD